MSYQDYRNQKLLEEKIQMTTSRINLQIQSKNKPLFFKIDEDVRYFHCDSATLQEYLQDLWQIRELIWEIRHGQRNLSSSALSQIRDRAWERWEKRVATPYRENNVIKLYYDAESKIRCSTCSSVRWIEVLCTDDDRYYARRVCEICGSQQCFVADPKNLDKRLNYKQSIVAMLKQPSKLSEWETQFLSSVYTELDGKGKITPNQESRLRTIASRLKVNPDKPPVTFSLDPSGDAQRLDHLIEQARQGKDRLKENKRSEIERQRVLDELEDTVIDISDLISSPKERVENGINKQRGKNGVSPLSKLIVELASSWQSQSKYPNFMLDAVKKKGFILEQQGEMLRIVDYQKP